MSKQNEGKPELSLIYYSFMKEIAKVRKFGVDKYGDKEDWRTTSKQLHYDACLRHIMSKLSGESIDKESGLSHLAHASVNLMFLIEEEETELNNL